MMLLRMEQVRRWVKLTKKQLHSRDIDRIRVAFLKKNKRSAGKLLQRYREGEAFDFNKLICEDLQCESANDMKVFVFFWRAEATHVPVDLTDDKFYLALAQLGGPVLRGSGSVTPLPSVMAACPNPSACMAGGGLPT